MKKILVVVLSLAMVMTMLAGCGKAEKVKTGLAVITSASKSKDAGEEDGLMQADSTVAAVLVNDKGVIVDLAIDVIQTKVNFNANGEITTDLAKEYVSKYELGDAYDMRKASPIGKEWDEQAEALEKYVIGKTLEEVKGIALDEKGYPTEEDLTSSVTMNIAAIISAVDKAVANAQDLGATAKDKVGVGMISKISKSKNAGEENGLAQAYSTYAAVSVDAKGKITSTIVEASQANAKIDAAGKIVDLPTEFKTKTELGDAYDMKKASPIGKEWFEQAKAFADYITGKTLDEVKGIKLTEGAPDDLTSSVTMTVTEMITSIEKAVATANK